MKRAELEVLVKESYKVAYANHAGNGNLDPVAAVILDHALQDARVRLGTNGSSGTEAALLEKSWPEARSKLHGGGICPI